MNEYKSGFVGIFGKPNAGKSTLMNALLQEKLAIVSPKAQTTRNKILGILTEKNYQIIFSDTPGMLQANYKLHERMMDEVHQTKLGTDVILFLVDATDEVDENIKLLQTLRTQAVCLVVINKIDKSNQQQVEQMVAAFKTVSYVKQIIPISALAQENLQHLISIIVSYLPEMPPYYDEDTLTDRPMRFFVAELIREKIMTELSDELPYHAAVIIRQFEEKPSITKITAEIIVSRESQKAIVIGKGGSMISRIGMLARTDIEKFIERKVFLDLRVKVRNDWRNNHLYLKEYGY